MEGSFPDKQEIIQTTSNVFQTTQLTRNIPENDEQHFPGTTLWRSVGKLHGWLCYTSQNYKGTQEIND